MTHVRKQIRDAIVARLINMTDAGDKVHAHRIRHIDPEHCPCIVVNTDDETINTVPGDTALFERKLIINLYIYAATNTAVDDVMDNISAQVEGKLWESYPASTLGGLLFQSMNLTGVKLEFDGETSDTEIGRLTMQISADYATESDDPNNFTS